MSDQQIVKDWMQKFGQSCPDAPCIPSLEVRRLRAKLILEEALETIRALGFAVQVVDTYFDRQVFEPNLEAIADGCADLRVVTVGTEVACGIPADQTFAEVMRSNDSKLWTYRESLSVNAEFLETHTIEFTGNEKSDRPFLVKDKDGKVVKSPSFIKPNLMQYVESR